MIIYRLSMLDLMPGGSSWAEVVALACAIEAAGANLINTGIGWHEARIPTIATMVPRSAFTWVTAKLKGEVAVPLITSNRINTPELVEAALARGDADGALFGVPITIKDNFRVEGTPTSLGLDRCLDSLDTNRDHVGSPGLCLRQGCPDRLTTSCPPRSGILFRPSGGTGQVSVGRSAQSQKRAVEGKDSSFQATGSQVYSQQASHGIL